MGTSININIYYTWFVLKKKLVQLSEVFGRKSTTFICRINSNNRFGFKNNYYCPLKLMTKVKK